jgi:hypothetical protein
MLFFDGHAPDVHHHALLVEDGSDLRVCFAEEVFLELYKRSDKASLSLHKLVLKPIWDILQVLGHADSDQFLIFVCVEAPDRNSVGHGVI